MRQVMYMEVNNFDGRALDLPMQPYNHVPFNWIDAKDSLKQPGFYSTGSAVQL